MARFAGFLELAFVGIDVAGGAGVEFHVLIVNGPARSFGLVALFASYFNVQAGEGITSLGMIEFLGGLPTFDVVAFGAFVAELAFVGIAMAGSAIGGLAEERLGEIFHLNEFPIGGKHVRRSVALFASNIGVLTLQFVAGLQVIEFLERRDPTNQGEGLTIVLEMAVDAVFAIGIGHLNLKVIAVPGGKILRDFFVAIDALEGGSAGAEGVTRSALRSASKRRVRFGKRTRRNLGVDRERDKQSYAEEQERTKKSSREESAKRACGDAALRAYWHAVLRCPARKTPVPAWDGCK